MNYRVRVALGQTSAPRGLRITSLVLTILTLVFTLPAVFAQVTHVANPYVGAQGYVNPDYATEISQAIATQPAGSTLATQMSVVATYPTAVWMDHIGAITATSGAHRGLQGHITAALAQQANSSSKEPVVVEIVIYDLPDRDCAALASNGELSIAGNDTVNINGVPTLLTNSTGQTETGLQEYENNYITPIFNILQSEASNPNIRFALVVEDDSLPNLITNAGLSFGLSNCVAANGGVTNSSGTDINYSGSVYIQGIAYAINQFHQLPNVYTYLDVGHHGWLGWPVNMAAGVTLFKTFVTTQLTDSYASLDGFITNTANYGAVKEPFLTFNEPVGGAQVYQSTCTSTWCGFQFNPNIDEQDYALNFAAALTTPTTSTFKFVDGSSVAGGGFPSGLGFLIDTSRDGWGSSLRPTAASTSTVLDTFVQDSLIDLRDDMGQWCNQTNTGLGTPPTATPTPGILAYVWIKPPGESDGNYPGSVYAGTNDGALDGVASTVGDPNCNPAHDNALANSQATNAMANSPSAGTFWPAEFTMYVQNAFPAVPATTLPGFGISASSVSVEQGTNAASGVSVTAINGFSSPVALSVISTLPSGVTASFNPTSVTGSAGSTLTFTASNSAATGPVTVTVQGTGGGVTEPANLTLTVTPRPNFTISVSPTSLNLPPNTNPTATVTVTFVGGLTGSVALSAANLPNGVSANFAPSSLNATGTSVVNFTSQTSTPSGSETISIVGADNVNGTTITNSAPLTLITGTSQSQTITFANPGAQTVGTPLTLSATASSGLTVSFASQTTSVCTVSGTTATFLTTGTCTIQATQAGNSAFAAATPVSQSFTVNPGTLKSQTITFANPGAQTVGTPLTLSATASSGLTVSFASQTTSVCTVSGTTATFLTTGTCTIQATQAGNSAFAAATPVSQSFTVNPGTLKSQTITFANPGTQTVGTPLTLSATASSGLTVSFASQTTSVCTVSGTTATFLTTGTCTIQATQAGNSAFAAATPVSQSFTVNPGTLKSQTITFANPGAQTVGTPLTLSATASSGLTVSFASQTTSVCTVSGTTATFLTTGTCTIQATQAGNSAFAAATPVSQSFTVNPGTLKSQTITFANPGTQTVGTPLTLSATASSGLTVSFASQTTSVCTVSGTTATFLTTGTCTIQATQAGNSAFAAATPVSQSFTVNPMNTANYCHVIYTINNQWPGGFGAGITLQNTGTANWTSWTLTWSFANGQTVTQLWNGAETQSGAIVTASNLSYNGSIPAGGSYNGMGFNGSWNNVTNAVPTAFAINGHTCN